jgi:AcrR family transcriptional regulator
VARSASVVYIVYYEYTLYTCAVSRLTRSAVLAEALALGDESGIEAVTIRGVADRLGVTPMALYRHVGDKEGLLDGVADALYAKLRIPEPTDWWEGLARLARSTRNLLLQHPWAVPLFSRPLTGPHSLALESALAESLKKAGFSSGEATELHEQLSNILFALVTPELHGRRNRAAFERGLDLIRDGLTARLSRR